MNSSTLTFRAPGRNHIGSTAFETIAKALNYWNSRILLFRSSSEMFVHRHWERIEKHSLSIIVTKRESTRQHEASSNLRAARVSIEVAKRVTKKFSAKHVRNSSVTLKPGTSSCGRKATRRLRPPPSCDKCVIVFAVRCSLCVQIVDVGLYVCVLRVVRAVVCCSVAIISMRS